MLRIRQYLSFGMFVVCYWATSSHAQNPKANIRGFVQWGVSGIYSYHSSRTHIESYRLGKLRGDLSIMTCHSR